MARHIARDVALLLGQSMTRRNRVYKALGKETFIHLQTSQKDAPEQHSGGGVTGALTEQRAGPSTPPQERRCDLQQLLYGREGQGGSGKVRLGSSARKPVTTTLTQATSVSRRG